MTKGSGASNEQQDIQKELTLLKQKIKKQQTTNERRTTLRSNIDWEEFEQEMDETKAVIKASDETHKSRQKRSRDEAESEVVQEDSSPVKRGRLGAGDLNKKSAMTVDDLLEDIASIKAQADQLKPSQRYTQSAAVNSEKEEKNSHGASKKSVLDIVRHNVEKSQTGPKKKTKRPATFLNPTQSSLAKQEENVVSLMK